MREKRRRQAEQRGEEGSQTPGGLQTPEGSQTTERRLRHDAPVTPDSGGALVVVEGAPGALLVTPQSLRRLVEQFLAEQSPLTRQGYRQDLERFAGFLGVSLDGLADRFFRFSGGEANYYVSAFKTHLRDHGGHDGKPGSAATVNRRIAAIKSFTKMGRLLGIISWHIEVPNMKPEGQRDTRGPGLEEVRKIVAEAKKNERLYAIVLLLFVRGLRSVEVRELRREDVNLERGEIAIRGKGKREREWITIPPLVVNALRAWIVGWRGDEPGALFPALDGGPLRANVFWRVLSRLAERAGLHAWPHGLRHSAITLGLDLTDGNVRSVRAFSRHANVETVMVYDDQRRDLGGDVSSQLAKLIEEE